MLARDSEAETVGMTQAEATEHDAWFRKKVADGIADARAGRVRSSKEVEAHFAKRRADTRKRLCQARR